MGTVLMVARIDPHPGPAFPYVWNAQQDWASWCRQHRDSEIIEMFRAGTGTQPVAIPDRYTVSEKSDSRLGIRWVVTDTSRNLNSLVGIDCAVFYGENAEEFANNHAYVLNDIEDRNREQREARNRVRSSEHMPLIT